MHEVWEQDNMYQKQAGGLEKAPRGNDPSTEFYRQSKKYRPKQRRRERILEEAWVCGEEYHIFKRLLVVQD